MSPEGLSNQRFAKREETPVLDEAAAEAELSKILEDHNFKFLTEIETNRKFIEEAPTANEALAFAQQKISERLRRSLDVRTRTNTTEGLSEMSPETMLHMINSIKEHQMLIGEGGDAWVVTDRNEVREFPPEICYKLFKEEATPRGRNTATIEHDIQSAVYELLQQSSLRIQAPAPFYAVELGAEKMIAMEKLNAASVDDIIRSHGSLPDWLDIDAFCDELKRAIDLMHENHIYHRDMHEGNVMIVQTPTDEGGPVGYIIDFGLSGYAYDEEFAYQKEVAGMNFTYNRDYGIIETVRSDLKKLRQSKVGKGYVDEN